MESPRKKLLVAIIEKLTSFPQESLEEIDRRSRESQTRAVIALFESQQKYDGDPDRIPYGPRRYTS